jgi:hypothetical protein
MADGSGDNQRVERVAVYHAIQHIPLSLEAVVGAERAAGKTQQTRRLIPERVVDSPEDVLAVGILGGSEEQTNGIQLRSCDFRPALSIIDESQIETIRYES